MRHAVSSGWNLDGLVNVLQQADPLPWISDDEMRANLTRSAAYTVVVLSPTSSNPSIWSRWRRNHGTIAR